MIALKFFSCNIFVASMASSVILSDVSNDVALYVSFSLDSHFSSLMLLQKEQEEISWFKPKIPLINFSFFKIIFI